MFSRASRGFTLVEIAVAIGVFVLLLIPLFAFYGNIGDFSRSFQINLEAQREVRLALRRMTSEIRSAAPSSSGAYPISAATTTSFIFYRDLEGDGLRERVRYSVENGDLKRGVIEPTGVPAVYDVGSERVETIVHDILNDDEDVFEYFDDEGAELSQPTSIPDVRLVKVTIFLGGTDPTDPKPLTFTTQVTLRNLKENL